MTDKRASADGRRSTYHHGELRQALVRAADQIIRENGIEGFALREAARRAGVSPGAPAHHFASVRGLLTEVATLGYDELGRDLATVPKGTGPADAVRAFAMGYIRYALRHPGRFRLMCRKDLVDRTAPDLVASSTAAMMPFAAAAAAYHGEEFGGAARIAGPGMLASIAAAHGMAFMSIEDKWAFMLDQADPETDLMRRVLPAILRAQWPDVPGRTAQP